MSVKQDLKTAIDLLRRVDCYGIRLEMGTNWSRELDAFMLRMEDQEEHGHEQQGEQDE